jgi:hypothetical protein
VRLSVSGLCCDAPATSFALNITTHTAYFACRKCITRGVYVRNIIHCLTRGKKGGRVTFPQLDAALRTDASFRQRHQPKHHNKNGHKSLIEDILADIVGDVPLDYMHVVCIGVFKKLLTLWVSGAFDHDRFSKEAILAISAYRIYIRSYIPREFVRKTRGMEELPRWKCTELRLDLLYLCVVAYRPFLTTERYKHLLLLHVAIKILVNKEMCQTYAAYAETLLKTFVSACSKLYGATFISYNVHSLIHLPNDVLKHGSLDEFSAFPFENKLQKIKNLLRTSGRPLQQVVRRLEEIDRANSISQHHEEPSNSLAVRLTGFHCTGPLLPHLFSGDQYGKLECRGLYLTTKKPDNCVFVNGPNGQVQVVVIENFVRLQGQMYVLGRKYLCQQNIYDYPLPSSLLNEVLAYQLSPDLQSFALNDVKWKAVRIPTSLPETGHFFICPLLHHSVF